MTADGLHPTISGGDVVGRHYASKQQYRWAFERHSGMIIAGANAINAGDARWCIGCDELRLHWAMDWTIDGQYLCSGCRGGQAPSDDVDRLFDPDPDTASALIPIFASVPQSRIAEQDGWDDPHAVNGAFGL